MSDTPRSEGTTAQPWFQDISTRLQRIAELAGADPQMAFTALGHFLDDGLLREAFARTRKDGAPGIDGQTAADFAADLAGNVDRLIGQARSGRYRAPAVRRKHIPKGGGKTRPIGIPTFSDKVLQRAVSMILEPIYEKDFHDFSYSFRPGRSAHDAISAIWRETKRLGGCWIVEVDIKSFFDNLQHPHLRDLLELRVRDGVLRRLIGKWLNAGVWECGELRYPDAGTPQGGVISPLLANIYLHYVLDEWFAKDVQPHLKGRNFIVRYADDFVLGFEEESDALRMMAVLPKRFGRYGLTIHPEKTRLVDFRRPDRRPSTTREDELPSSFVFLGFLHTWGRSRKGRWVVRQQTSKDRFGRSLKGIHKWCRTQRHLRVAQQHAGLCSRVRGHMNYFGVTGNMRRIAAFVRATERIWRSWLNRRSQLRSMPWARFQRLLTRYPLPPPRLPRSVFVT